MADCRHCRQNLYAWNSTSDAVHSRSRAEGRGRDRNLCSAGCGTGSSNDDIDGNDAEDDDDDVEEGCDDVEEDDSVRKGKVIEDRFSAPADDVDVDVALSLIARRCCCWRAAARALASTVSRSGFHLATYTRGSSDTIPFFSRAELACSCFAVDEDVVVELDNNDECVDVPGTACGYPSQ